MISARSDKERLRSMIGALDMADSFGQNAMKDPEMYIADKHQLPAAGELVLLLQQQDQVITELHEQLFLCKHEMVYLKDQNVTQSDENRKVFEELRAQILKQNLSKAFSSSTHTPPVKDDKPSQERKQILSSSSTCHTCAMLRDSVVILEKEKQTQTDKLSNALKELKDAKSEEKVLVQKVRNAVQVADQAVLEKTELFQVNLKLKHHQETVVRQSEEVKNLTARHQQSLVQFKENAIAAYNTELIHLKSQLAIAQDKDEETAKQKNELETLCRGLKQELDDVQHMLMTKEADFQQQIASSQTLIRETQQQNNAIKKEMKRFVHEGELESVKLKQTNAHLEQNLSDKSIQLQAANTSLSVLKKENMELKEKCAMLEKDVGNLRISKRKVENEKEMLMQTSSLKLKESSRIAELKQEQTKNELEQMLNTQNVLISKLKEECRIITEKMSRITKEYKSEISLLKRKKKQKNLKAEFDESDSTLN